jgi:hypothetical protein
MTAKRGVSAAIVARHWRANGLKSHPVRGCKVARDPKFVEKLEDIVGLYMAPPAHARVLCCDEKSQLQALDRTQPGLPLTTAWMQEVEQRRSSCRRRVAAPPVTHDDKRNGTSTLFAALNVLDGQVIAQCQPRHRHTEWLAFLRQIERETPRHKTLHLSADNDATHKHPKVQAWLDKRPRFTVRYTPTSASWLNTVKRFFRDITTARIRRGVFTSVPELITTIDDYIAHHHRQPKPFLWSRSARDILQKVIRANRRSSSRQNAALR